MHNRIYQKYAQAFLDPVQIDEVDFNEALRLARTN
jgi:hypothetical protein